MLARGRPVAGRGPPPAPSPAALPGQLDRCDAEVHAAALADDAKGHAATDGVAEHEALQVARRRHGGAVERDDDVARAQARACRGASADDLDHLEPGLELCPPSDPRRKGPAYPGDAEVGAPDAAVGHERGDD